MRIQMNRKNNKLYRCFCCFHVRNGALALGIWHMMVHLFAVSLLAYISVNIEEINNSVQSLTIYIHRTKIQTGSDNVGMIDPSTLKLNQQQQLNNTLSSNAQSDEPFALPVSLQITNDGVASSVKGKTTNTFPFISETDEERIVDEESDKKFVYWTSYFHSYVAGSGLYQVRINQDNLTAAFIIGCIIIITSLMMIVGIIKGKPAYIFPFLGFLVGDLFVSSMTVAGVICLGPNIKQFLLSSDELSFRGDVKQFDNHGWIFMSIILAILAVIFIKAYFVRVVWQTILYLREKMIRKAREEFQPKVIYLDANSSSVDGESTLIMFDHDGGIIKNSSPPPAYEHSEEKTAPPVYSA